MSVGFFKRAGAYIIDIVLVMIMASLITSFIPNKKINDLSLEYSEFVYENFNKMDSEDFDIDGFNEKLDDYTYQISKASIGSNLVLISIYVLYFIGFNRYNNGQTVGKKLLKIEITDKDGNVPNIKQLCIRGLILYPIVFDILNVILISMLSKSLFLSISSGLSIIRFIILLICSISIMGTSEGIHDKLSGTKVVLFESMNEEDKATKWRKNTEKEKKLKSYKNNHTSGKKRG